MYVFERIEGGWLIELTGEYVEDAIVDNSYKGGCSLK